jgi:hypothetical protein
VLVLAHVQCLAETKGNLFSFFSTGITVPFPIGFCYRQVAILLRLLHRRHHHFPPYHWNT